jgi:hypothetical protein
MGSANSASKLKGSVFVVGIAVLSFVVALGVLYALGSKSRRSRGGDAESLSSKSKPFDPRKTKQIFQLLLNGGLQTVIIINPADEEQIALIQTRLKEQAERFQKGDFSDSLIIPGTEMPGVAEMQLGVKQITIRYDPLSDGGQISYSSANPELVNSIHRWLMAQLSEQSKNAARR